MTYGYLADLALILLATKALSMLTGKLQMPQVVGALVAGLVMGPAVLNIIQPSDFLSQVAELGVIVIMFSAGMGTDLNELKQTGKAGLVIAMAGVLVPLAMDAVGMAYAQTTWAHAYNWLLSLDRAQREEVRSYRFPNQM